MKRLDRIFKDIFQKKEQFLEFLQMFLPDLVEKYSITEESLVKERTEIISHTLRSSMIDVLYRIKTKDIDAFVFILLEHQTNKDYLMPFRMLEYTVAIWRHYIDESKSIAKRKSFKLPPVVPIVYYEGSGRWTVERDIMEKVRKLSGYEKYIPRLEYMVIEASGLEKEWLLDGETALSKLIYASIVDKEEFERNKDRFEESVRRLRKSKIMTILDLIKQIIESSKELSKEELEELEGFVSNMEVEGMFTKLLGSAKEEGRKEGRIEGLLEARREAIYEILEERFGEVPEDIKETVEKIADTKKLSLLHRKSISVKDFDEFRKLLKSGSE